MAKSNYSFLLLALLLASCGGGGGSGSSVGSTSFSSNSSLPSVTTLTRMKTSVNTEGEATDMVTASLDEGFYEDHGALTGSSVSTLAVVKTAAVKKSKDCTSISECNQFAYGRMKKWLIDGDYNNMLHATEADADELRDALLLAGYNDMANNCKKDHKSGCTVSNLISGLTKEVFDSLRMTASSRFENYNMGSVSLENARLKLSDEESDDAYVRFTLGKDKNINGMVFDYVEDGKTEKIQLTRQKDNSFQNNSLKVYKYGLIVGTDCTKGACSPDSGHDFAYESIGKPAKNIQEIKAGLLAELQKQYADGEFAFLHGGPNGAAEPGDAEALFAYVRDELIPNLTMADFDGSKSMDDRHTDHAFYDLETSKITTKYNSYAKEMNLAYSDFGVIDLDLKTTHSNRKSGNLEEEDTAYVFAGGYEAKRIDPSLIQGELNFEGIAKGRVVYVSENNYVDSQDVVSKKKDLDGKLTLNFKNGAETLNAKFNNWYDVTVRPNAGDPSKRDIEFKNGNRITDNDFKFRGQNTYVVTDMTGAQQIKAGGNEHVVVPPDEHGYVTGESNGLVHTAYYGDRGRPSEVTGYVAYIENTPYRSDGLPPDTPGSVEDLDRVKSLDLEMAFGAKKK